MSETEKMSTIEAGIRAIALDELLTVLRECPRNQDGSLSVDVLTAIILLRIREIIKQSKVSE